MAAVMVSSSQKWIHIASLLRPANIVTVKQQLWGKCTTFVPH